MATITVEKETKKRERGEGDKKMEKENVEHELVSNCLDYLLTLKVDRKNYIEILNTIERDLPSWERQILIPLFP